MKELVLISLSCFAAILLCGEAKSIEDTAINGSNQTTSDYQMRGWDQDSLQKHHSNQSVNLFQKSFLIKMNVSDDIEFKCLESPVFELSQIFWRTKLCSVLSGNAKTVYIYLESSFTSNYWSCEVQAKFKVHPKSSSYSPIAGTITKKKFTNTNPIYGFDTYTSWSTFKNNYVDVDQLATFEVDIATSGLNRTIGAEDASVKFHFLVEDVSKFTYKASPVLNVRNINWNVIVERGPQNLEVMLQADKNDMDIDLSWYVTASFKLLSLTYGSAAATKFSYTFHRRDARFGYLNITSWDNLVNSYYKYIVNDAIVLSVELYVDPPKRLWENDDSFNMNAAEALEN